MTHEEALALASKPADDADVDEAWDTARKYPANFEVQGTLCSRIKSDAARIKTLEAELAQAKERYGVALECQEVLEAQLAKVTASRDGWERDALVYAQNAGKAEAERDAAVAQVAVLVEALRSAIGYVRIQRSEDPKEPLTAGHKIHMADGDRLIALGDRFLSDLPAAANALLAKAAEVEGLRAHQEQAGGQG